MNYLNTVFSSITKENLHHYFSGASIERRDKDNFTPLLIAASEGHTASIEVLLRFNANINATDKHEKTAIFWAAEERQIDALKVNLKRKHKVVLTLLWTIFSTFFAHGKRTLC